MDFETFYWKYVNQRNPKTGKLWTAQEMALDSSLTLSQVEAWISFYQNFYAQCVQDGKPYDPESMFAARYVVNPDDRPLAADEYWEVRPGGPFGSVRVRVRRQTTPVESDVITLLKNIQQSITDLRTALGK